MTSLSYQQIEMFGKDLPDHAHHVRMYTLNGLDDATATSLEDRAARIITLGRRAILEIGNELLQARREAAHGTWGAFLARCGMAERTAQNYINVAEKFGDRPDVLRLLPPTALYALAADSADPAAVEAVIAEAQAGQTPTVADVQAKVRGKPRSSWLRCASCGAKVAQLYGEGYCNACYPNRPKKAWRPALDVEPTLAPVTAITYASAAEGHLLDAQHAGPGSTPRGMALTGYSAERLAALAALTDAERAAQASDELDIADSYPAGSQNRQIHLRTAYCLIQQVPAGARDALTERHAILLNAHTHAAAVPPPATQPTAAELPACAVTLTAAGWRFSPAGSTNGRFAFERDGLLFSLSAAEVAIAAALVADNPAIAARQVLAGIQSRGSEPIPAPTQPAALPADIALFAQIYGMSAEADEYDGEPAVWLLWPNDDKNDVMALPLDDAREFLRGGAASLAGEYAPADCLFQRAAAAGYDILDVSEECRLEVAHDDLPDGTLMTVDELEARLGGRLAPAAAPGISRQERTQLNDLWQQTQAAFDDNDRAHTLRCLWQMAILAAGSEREARMWAERNAR